MCIGCPVTESLEVENNRGIKYKYTQNDFILDCIEFKLKEFEVLYKTKNPKHIQRQKINNTSDETKYWYSDEVKEKYKEVSPLEEYIKVKANAWGTSANAIKKYYLAKQINSLLVEYVEEQDVYANGEEYI